MKFRVRREVYSFKDHDYEMREDIIPADSFSILPGGVVFYRFDAKRAPLSERPVRAFSTWEEIEAVE